MTEEDAKTKWCPMASNRTVSYIDNNGSNIATANVNDDGKLVTTCIASDCMAWVIDTPKGDSSDGRMHIHSTCEYGHCGLTK